MANGKWTAAATGIGGLVMVWPALGAFILSILPAILITMALVLLLGTITLPWWLGFAVALGSIIFSAFLLRYWTKGKITMQQLAVGQIFAILVLFFSADIGNLARSSLGLGAFASTNAVQFGTVVIPIDFTGIALWTLLGSMKMPIYFAAAAVVLFSVAIMLAISSKKK